MPSRATYRLATKRQHGHTTASIPHKWIEAFLSVVPLVDDEGEDLDLTISVGSVDSEGVVRDAVRFACGNWRLTLWLLHPLGSRWGTRLAEVLASTDCEQMDIDMSEWRINRNTVDVWVRLHAGHPDVVRVSAPLLTHIDESLELLRELGQLNAASLGLRYWWEDGVVRVMADVRCTAMHTVVDVIDDVALAVNTYRPMLVAFASA